MENIRKPLPHNCSITNEEMEHFCNLYVDCRDFYKQFKKKDFKWNKGTCHSVWQMAGDILEISTGERPVGKTINMKSPKREKDGVVEKTWAHIQDLKKALQGKTVFNVDHKIIEEEVKQDFKWGSMHPQKNASKVYKKFLPIYRKFEDSYYPYTNGGFSPQDFFEISEYNNNRELAHQIIKFTFKYVSEEKLREQAGSEKVNLEKIINITDVGPKARDAMKKQLINRIKRFDDFAARIFYYLYHSKPKIVKETTKKKKTDFSEPLIPHWFEMSWRIFKKQWNDDIETDLAHKFIQDNTRLIRNLFKYARKIRKQLNKQLDGSCELSTLNKGIETEALIEPILNSGKIIERLIEKQEIDKKPEKEAKKINKKLGKEYSNAYNSSHGSIKSMLALAEDLKRYQELLNILESTEIDLKEAISQHWEPWSEPDERGNRTRISKGSYWQGQYYLLLDAVRKEIDKFYKNPRKTDLHKLDKAVKKVTGETK